MVTVVKYLTQEKYDLTDQYQECVTLAKRYDSSITDEEILQYQKAVLQSNFSKFCEDQDEVDKTIQKYAQIGVIVKGVAVGDLFVIRSSSDQIGNDGKSYPKNKILKSINYKEPSAYLKF